MAEGKKGYFISDIYPGSSSSMDSPYNPYITAGSLGMTTDPRSANVIQEVSSKLSSGAKQIEVEAVSPEIFDSIPKQHLREVNRLAKLTGVNLSLHGPVIDTSGFSRNGFSETGREESERKIAETLRRGYELNPDGNILVNFHSAEGIAGSQLLPPSKREEGKEYQRMIVVNKETGEITALEPEIQYTPGQELKPISFTPEHRLQSLNETRWDNAISQMIFNKERADEILNQNRIPIQHLLEDLQKGNIKTNQLQPEQIEAWRHFQDADAYLRNVHREINSLYSRAVEFGTDKQKEILADISRGFGKEVAQSGTDPFALSQAMHNLLHQLKAPDVIPNVYEKIEDFAVKQSSKTFGNAAWESYKEHKDKAPVLVIENPPAGFALSTGKDIKNVVEASREKFVQNAVAEGMSESQAKEQAEKLIGATWDVGHINMLRKYGYSNEEIVKEAEEIAPLLKHVHLSDNFGYEHTELPMGMGNVPLKEIMEKLGQKGFDAKKIIEASAWWQHQKTAPFQETLEAMGSPIYGMRMAPYWNQTEGLYRGYMGGMEGSWLPQTNYETFGTTFSRLPKELGGTRPGAEGSRMSGRSME